jgi:outer membrane cobalamin receptor
VLPGHALLSAGAEVTIAVPNPDRPGFEVILRGENLTDATYEEAYGYAAPGRGLYVGGRIRWGPR